MGKPGDDWRLHLERCDLIVQTVEAVEPGHTLFYTPGIRSIETFPLRFTAAT